MSNGDERAGRAHWREQLYIIIFEADTPAGKFFDLGLLASIGLSTFAVMAESVESLKAQHGSLLNAIEWFLTLSFTIEYVLRLFCVRRPIRYAFSFFGIVDLLSIVPSYLSLFIPGAESLVVIRTLRLLRIFRILKLTRFLGQANILTQALKMSVHKVAVFLGTIVILIVILGTAMYLVEGDEGGFTNIPQSMYWAVVTMTTVGYGDIAPITPMGKALAAAVMILGYAIIAVPTGIVTAELVEAARETTTRVCPACLTTGHASRARFCQDCGQSLPFPPGVEPAAGGDSP